MDPRPDLHNKEALDRLLEENAFLRSALEKTDPGKELIRQREEFSQLLAVSKLIVSELSLETVFQLVASKARDLVQADMLLVPMLNEARDRYTYKAASGADAEAVLEANFPITTGMCGWVLRNERSLLFGESSPCWLDEATAWERGQESAVLVPLFGRKQIIGGLSALGKRGGGSFTPHDLDLLTMFANQVSTAIENATLFHKVESEIEERRQAEIALRESEQSYKTLAENLPGLVYRVFTREKNRMKFFNRSSRTMTGYSEHELECGETCSIVTLIVPEDRAAVVVEVQRAQRENKPFSVEYRLRHKDGTIRYLSELGAPISGSDGKPLYIDGVIFDNTDREREARLLAESDTRLRTLVQTIPDLIWLKDANGVYLSCNPVFERLYGAREADIIGKTDYDFVSKELADFFREHDKKAMETGKPSSNEEWLTFADSGYRGRFDTIKAPMYNSEGALIGVLGIARDITERKRAEEQIIRSLKEKDVMLKEIHHRVKNNMQVIYSLLSLQAKSIADPSVRALFVESQNRVHSMALIHERLYRSEDLAHIDFKEYLQRLVAGIGETYKRRDVVLSVDMEPLSLDVTTGIPCGLIVNELVSNSLKYAFPEGRTGTVSVGIRKNQEGNYVLTVRDDGIGLPQSVDFRNTTSLGLQLVGVLAGQLYGTIEHSTATGTTFTITFPGARESTGERRRADVRAGEDMHNE
jgi:PAS domain S-box-containing protein